MGKQILLPAAEAREIREQFKVGRNDLRRALNYERNSSRAKILRQAALERGGLIYTGLKAPAGFIPNVDILFSQTERSIEQKLNDRVIVQIDRNTHKAVLKVDGEKLLVIENINTENWSDILYSIQLLFNHSIK